MTGAAASSSSLHCKKCGAVIEAGARFCGVCGAAADLPSSSGDDHPAHADDAHVVFPTTPSKAAKSPLLAKPAAPAPSPVPSTLTPINKDYAKARSVDRLVGRTLNNRYEIDKKIGEGGFGAVFRGKQIATGREVALKILHPHNVSDATVVARFKREAEACSKLRDPHTVITYDFDETEDGILYLAMEMLHGRSLQQLQKKEGILDPHRVLGILDQVAQALGEAHGQGIVHRDMKPENVMVETRGTEDFVKVLDFGIAKIVKSEAMRGPALTAIGQTVGTLEFMSPEQLRGKDLDGRSDIYALGMMAYEMLSGELPFKDASSSTEVIEFHLHKPPPPPSKLRPDLEIPEYVDAVVLKMVAKSRDDRHADTSELREHIARALAEADTSSSRREMMRVAAVVGSLAVAIAIIAFLLSR